MSSNTPANPGWIRAIPRPAGPATDVESNSASEQEQQQQQQQARQQPHSSPSNSSTAGFASSFSAFFPRPGGPGAGQASEPDLGEYPLYSSRRGARPTASASTASTSPPFGFSPPSPYAASSSQALSSSTAIPPPVSAMPLAGPSSLTLPYASTARLRRPSVLATSSLLPDPDEDEDSEGASHARYSRSGDPNGSSPSGSRMTSVSVDGQDEANSMAMGDDIDMDGFEAGATTSGVTAGGPGTASGMSGARTAAIAIPGRARSHSQSSSVMASSAHLARSPSAWPNSPPRTGFTPSANPQHLLARLTSEQQQAMVASANSASSAYYMIPTPYRQAMAAGNGDDLLLGDLNEQAIDDGDLIEEEENDMLSSKPSASSSRKQSSGMSRSFNPLNPYSERPPSGQKRDGSREDSMNMDESPQLSPANRSGTAQALRSPPQNPSLNSLQQSSLSLLRASKSSPALADMNASPQTSPFPASKGNRSSEISDIPFPSSNPPTPTTPPHQPTHQPGRSNHSGLRRSQSASHRPAELLSIMRQRESSSMQSDTPPLTAPPVSNVFRYQRANSLSDFSRLQRQAGFNMEPINTLQSSRTDSSSSAMDMATQSVDQSKDRQPSGSSGSDSPNGGARVVRRAVSHKKGSLMPKSKDHLRTMAQLRLETGEFEVASEAALHRINQSSAAAPSALATPSRRNTTAGFSGVPSPFASLPRAAGLGYNVDSTAGPSNARPVSSHGGKPPFFNPVRNRFPESVADEEEEIDSSGSEPDYASAAEAGFDPASASDTGGGMMVGEDEEVSSNAGGDMNNGEGMTAFNRSAWTLRDPALGKPLTPGGPARPPGEMDLSPSSALGWSSMARPGKRKLNDSDRFEPYNAAFKRRAVSPASASSVSLSPLLATRELQGSAIPPPPPTLATLGPAAQISSALQGQNQNNLNSSVPPSPVISGGGTWLNPNKSRANSPAATVGMPVGPARRWPEEEKERKAVDLSKMSLG